MCAADTLQTVHTVTVGCTVDSAKLDLRQLLSVGYECNVAAEDTFKSISSMNQYRFITRQPVSIA